MKTKTILFLLCLPLFTFGQTKSTFDIIAGAGYSNMNLSNLDTFSLPLVNNEGRFNFRVGANYNHRISNHIWFKTGIRIARVGLKTETFRNLRWGSQNVNGMWVPDPSQPTEAQFFYDYLLLELPITLRYEFGNGRWSPFVELGASPNIFLTGVATLKTNLDTETRFGRDVAGEINDFHIVGHVSVGVNYKLTEKLFLFGQPIFRYHLTRLSVGSVVDRISSFGGELGVRLALK